MEKITYLQSGLQKERLVRWMDSCMPLKIYIAPFRWYKAKDEGYKYKNIVAKALEEWSKRSNGLVSFKVVNTLLESQINLDWKRIDRKALGHCHFHFDNANRLYSAEVQIGLSDGVIHSKYMDENEVYHTILHEIGHALGLGHSQNKLDIMYTPHQYGVVNLSSGDIASLQWLYKFPFGASLCELTQKYAVNAKDIDELILMILQKNTPSEFEQVKSQITLPQRDLLEEQTNIAQIKKYNLALQNIRVSPLVEEYFNKIQSNKNTAPED